MYICIENTLYTHICVLCKYVCVHVHARMCSGAGSSVLEVIIVYSKESWFFLGAVFSFVHCFLYVHIGVRSRYTIPTEKEQKEILKRNLKTSRHKIALLNQEQKCPKKLEFQGTTVMCL